MKSAVTFLVIVLVLACGYYYYTHVYRPQKDFAEGEVTCTGCLTPGQKAEFLKENSGEDADGQSEHKTTRGNISANGVAPASGAVAASGATSSTGIVAATGTTGTAGASGTGAYPPSQTTTYPAAQTTATTQTVSTATTGYGAPPAGDTIAPNAPNGMVFEGKGTYQWYRQGSITWRVNTMTGVSCIAFATDEEWRKERVVAHGCGRNA